MSAVPIVDPEYGIIWLTGYALYTDPGWPSASWRMWL
jgi:hypothetical protein